MDGRQELIDVFDGHPGDGPAPPAIFTQTGTVEQMRACGSSWPEANFDPDRMVTLALQAYRGLGFVTARVPFCLTVEAERLGAEVRPGSGDTQPSIAGSPYRDAEGVPSPPGCLMDPDEFVSGGRCAMVAEATRRISRENPGLFVTAGMQDPMAVTMQLLGAENTLMACILDPGAVEAWVKAVTPLSEAYAALLSEAADNVLVIGSSSTDLLSPEMVVDLSHPSLGRTVAAIRDSFSTIHSCGMTMGLLDGLVSMGADGLSLEASHDPEGFLSKVDGRCLMFGSIDPMTVLQTGTPGMVVEDARTYDRLGFDIITPECGVTPYTPDANLRALAHYRDM